jgi:hypothetical protein
LKSGFKLEKRLKSMSVADREKCNSLTRLRRAPSVVADRKKCNPRYHMYNCSTMKLQIERSATLRSRGSQT